MDVLTSSHNQLYKFLDNIMYGYEDSECQIPSGNVSGYEQTSSGPSDGSWYENTVRFRLNKKIIAENHFSFHLTINANGEIIYWKAEFEFKTPAEVIIRNFNPEGLKTGEWTYNKIK